MAWYCDSKVLEKNWFHWLLANATPVLEPYRAAGLLLSKVTPTTEEMDRNPFWGRPDRLRRAHCIAVETPVYFKSYNGKCDTPRYFVGSRPISCVLPTAQAPASQDCLQKLKNAGYFLEQPMAGSWDAILIDVKKICDGISHRFRLPSKEMYDDLASEAMVQTISKIKNMKLMYTPGRAPVFNLLTTTIHRIIYSILNKSTKERNNVTKHAQLVVPLASRGQNRLRGRIITRRVFGSLVSDSNR